MGYGRSTPKGHLPVYSVGDEEEARRLIVLTCPMDDAGNYYAPELAEAQTLANLERFSDRLHEAHQRLQASGRCDCAPTPERAAGTEQG